jgi:hypothetical protein
MLPMGYSSTRIQSIEKEKERERKREEKRNMLTERGRVRDGRMLVRLGA